MAQDATVVNVPNRPKTVPGSGLSDVVRRVSIYRKASFGFGDTTAINLFEIPGNVLVDNVLVRVTTPFDASGTSAAATVTVSMPNDTGTEVLFDANLTLLQSTGFKPATAIGLSPSSGGFIIANYTAGTTTAGVAEVYVSYVEFADKL